MDNNLSTEELFSLYTVGLCDYCHFRRKNYLNEWNDKHTKAYVAQRGIYRETSYITSRYTDYLCDECFDKLVRNRKIYPIISVVLLIAIPLLTNYYLFILSFVLLFSIQDVCSLLSLILKPVLGPYSVHPLGSSVNLSNKEKKRLVKYGTAYVRVLAYLSNRWLLGVLEIDEFFGCTKPCFNERLKNNEEIIDKSPQKIFKTLYPGVRENDIRYFDSKPYINERVRKTYKHHEQERRRDEKEFFKKFGK